MSSGVCGEEKRKMGRCAYVKENTEIGSVSAHFLYDAAEQPDSIRRDGSNCAGAGAANRAERTIRLGRSGEPVIDRKSVV